MKQIKILFFTFIILFVYIFTAIFSYTIIEPKVYDFMVKHVQTQKFGFDKSKNVYGHDDVVLILIDDKSIENYRWPWKRDLNNKVFKYLAEYAKPKVITYDAIIINPDNSNPESDKSFYKTLSNIDNLVAGTIFNQTSYKNTELGNAYDKIFIEKFSAKNVYLKTKLPYFYNSIKMSTPGFFDSVNYLGSVNLYPGFFDIFLSMYMGDETLRTQEPVIKYKDSIMTSLAMNTFLVANHNPKMIIEDKYIIFPDLNYKIKYIKTPFQVIVPTKFYKMHQNGYSHLKYSAVDIMDSYDNLKAGKQAIINPEIFKDKIVIFGADVKAGNGLNDNKKSPMKANHSGADIQASAIDNLIHNDFLKIVPIWLNFLIALLGIAGTYYIIKKFDLVRAINSILILNAIFLFSVTVCYYYGIIIFIAIPIVMCINTIIIAYINRYVIEERKKEKVTSAMSKYMSEDVVKDVLKNIDNLGLGGKRAIVTVLFSDIRGFTSMSEKMSAQEVSQLLNEYFSEMEPIVSRHNGIINKFIGDAVMAIFGEPIQDNNHPVNAVKCGYEMLERVKELDKKWEQEGKPVIHIGVGINTGEVFVGNIGSEKRMEYTVIGDTVNLASRLESYNKTYKTEILISSSTFEASKDFIITNEISDVEIRGKAEKMNIYEVKGIK